MRRVAVWTGSIVAGVTLLVATAAVVVETDWFKERLRRVAISRALEVLNGQLTIGRLSGSLLRGIELSNVVFQQPDGPVISVEAVEVRYDPRILFRGHFTFDELTLRRPVIHITERADGWNVANLVKPTKGGTAAAIQFDLLTITDGQVSVEPANGAVRRFADVAAGMELSYSAGALHVRLDTLSGRDADTGLVVSEGTGSVDVAERIVAEIDANTSAGALTANVSSKRASTGRVVNGEVVVSRLDLAPVFATAAFKTDLTGRASFQAVLPAEAETDPAVSFQVTASDVLALGYRAHQLHGQGSYSDGVLHIDGAASAYGASATAKGEWRIAPSHGRSSGLALSGRFQDLDARNVPAPLDVPRLAGRLAGQYDLTYAQGDLAVGVTFASSTLEGATIAAGSSARAGIRSGVPHYEASVDVQGVDLQRFAGPLDLAVLNEARFQSNLTGTVHVDGTGRDLATLALTGDATFADSTLGPTHISSGSATVNLEEQRLAISFKGPFEHLTGDLLGAGEGVPMDLAGTADVSVTLPDLTAPFSLDTLDAQGTVSLGPSTVGGYDLDQAAIDATVAAGQATIRDFRADGLALHAAANGTVVFDAEGDSNLNFTIETSSLDPASQRFGQQLSGGARIEGTVTGSQDHLVAKGSLASHEVKYGSSFEALTLNGTFEADVTDQQWRDFTAHANTEATFLTIAGHDIERLTTAATYHDHAFDLDTTVDEKDRNLQITGRVLLHPDHQEVHLRRLALSTAGVTWSLPAGQEATIQYAPDRVSVNDLRLTRGDESISIDGAFGLGAQPAADVAGLDLKVEQVQVADINRVLLGSRTLTGLLSGTAHLGGTPASRAATAKFTVTSGSVQGTTFNAFNAAAEYRDRRLTIDASLDQQPGARLTATGFVPIAIGGATPLSGDEPLDLRVGSTEINLGIFQAMTTEVSGLTGTGRFTLHVTGTPHAPVLDGSADLVNAGFKVEATGMSYVGANARLRFANDKVTIDQFVVRDEDGHTLTAEGGVDVTDNRNLQSVDLHVVADDMHLFKNDLGEVGLDADLKAAGELSHLTITGRASVDRGRLEVDKLLDRFAKSAYSTQPLGEPAERSSSAPVAGAEAAPGGGASVSSTSFFDGASVDLKLEMPDNVILRARNLKFGDSAAGLGSTNITIGGTIEVQKRPRGSVTLIGDVNAVRGFYDFQGKRFDLVRDSAVSFHGQRPIDPALNVTAERDISGVTAQVNLRGTARQPSIQLSSTPPLDEGDILSLIVFGQPMNQLGESDRVDLAQRAGSIALGAIASPLAESVGRALNLDVFEIRTEGTSGGTVSLGSQVGSRVFIGLRQEFGRDDVSVASFEYRMSRLLKLVTSVAQGATSTHTTRRDDSTGADLVFVIRY
jgi:autotransporter translocation and assembly factor TamB